MKRMSFVVSLLSIALVISIAAVNFGGCADDLVKSKTGSISAKNTGQGVKSVMIDGALYGALTPGESKVFDGFVPGKYLVEIQGCSAAFVTVVAGETRGFQCGADTEPGQ